ncbi:16S rRNA (cytosine(1402)-N(4))-methyltransferase RsmH [Sanyastnella coralliicola]|uniref:16S rRNA (cytosine(1402)-N(4))-methyltransferase RsmH n=1 Tax=Sanyastnella coralliicola TaxID=3069118 RepID=UPI0027B94712|nr:16S rRNA (cytosine(1402)-N(4))-methyltransferase RsmH [Longitalea sp. SCSIO 12813]
MEERDYHVPVLLHASIDALDIDPNGVYVDVTFGGGGHSREILTRLDQGKLFAFDQDPDAQDNVPEDDRFTLIPQNFRYMRNFLRMYGVTEVDGILADLGVSSHQFDAAERGFSLRFDAPLDMRMSQSGTKSAASILNEYEEGDLIRILKTYGEVRQAGRVVRAILKFRSEEGFKTTGDLNKVLQPFAPAMKAHKFQAQVYQALRIEVNDEMKALEEFLTQTEALLKPSGRLSVISYHSLEDRMVKRYMRAGNFQGEVKKDFYGNPITPWKVISRSAIVADEEEIEKNNRARSARLRIAERI